MRQQQHRAHAHFHSHLTHCPSNALSSVHLATSKNPIILDTDPQQGDFLFPMWLVTSVPSASCALRLPLSKSIRYRDKTMLIPLSSWEPLSAFSFPSYNFTHLLKRKRGTIPTVLKESGPPHLYSFTLFLLLLGLEVFSFPRYPSFSSC